MTDFGVIEPFYQSLGVGGIFLLVAWILGRRISTIMDDYRKDIVEKDIQLKQLNGQVLEAFRQNTQAFERNQAAVLENTKAVKTLSQYVYDALKQ